MVKFGFTPSGCKTPVPPPSTLPPSTLPPTSATPPPPSTPSPTSAPPPLMPPPSTPPPSTQRHRLPRCCLPRCYHLPRCRRRLPQRHGPRSSTPSPSSLPPDARLYAPTPTADHHAPSMPRPSAPVTSLCPRAPLFPASTQDK
jgi:hypothetical protein